MAIPISDNKVHTDTLAYKKGKSKGQQEPLVKLKLRERE